MRLMKTILFAEFLSAYCKMQRHSTTFCNFCWKMPAEKIKRCGQRCILCIAVSIYFSCRGTIQTWVADVARSPVRPDSVSTWSTWWTTGPWRTDNSSVLWHIKSQPLKCCKCTWSFPLRLHSSDFWEYAIIDF